MAFDPTQPAYKDLRNILSEGTDPLVAWVGAGLSIPAGLPSWGALKQELVAELKDFALRQHDVAFKRTLQFGSTLSLRGG